MYFRAKDYVTAGNAVCGVASVFSVIEGNLYWAAWLICLSWVFDALDGVVARLTNTFNVFGGEFDNMCDHLTYGIAPGFYVYGVYREAFPVPEWAQVVLAGVLGAWLPLTASIRGARLASKPIKVKGFWIGLPRPVSAFVTVSWFQSSTVALFPEAGLWLGVALVFGLGVSNLGAFPFLSHHGHVWKPWVSHWVRSVPVVLGLLALLGPVPAIFGHAVVPTELFFDAFFFYLFGYSVVQWWGIPDDEWQKVRAAVRAWRDAPEA